MAEHTDRNSRLASSVEALAYFSSQPVVIFTSLAIALVIGVTRRPEVQYLKPAGDFYVALLQMCVLPFLLATIPLAVRSAISSGGGRDVAARLLGWLFVTTFVISLFATLASQAIFALAPIDHDALAKMGVLVSASSNYSDIEFALDPERTAAGSPVLFSGLLSVIPDNVFAALASNDSMRVLVFATIFGVGMVFSEKRSGYSVFGALAHIQEVCVLIFDWFGVLVPLGIIVLVAPQIALLNSSAYAVLGLFCSAVLVVSGIVLLAVALTVSFVLRIPVGASMTSMLGPIMLGAATRNTLVCIPSSLEALAGQLRLRREPCELYVPIGFALVRIRPDHLLCRFSNVHGTDSGPELFCDRDCATCRLFGRGIIRDAGPRRSRGLDPLSRRIEAFWTFL